MENQSEKERQRMPGGAGLNTARPNKEGRQRNERGTGTREGHRGMSGRFCWPNDKRRRKGFVIVQASNCTIGISLELDPEAKETSALRVAAGCPWIRHRRQ